MTARFRRLLPAAFLGLLGLLAPRPATAADHRALQDQILTGQAPLALQELEKALAADPDNPRLLYNHGLAAYAAGRFDEALVSFDRAEYGGQPRIARLARFQKGNTEYRLGQAARQANLDETIARWRQSLDNYKELLKSNPADRRGEDNFNFVRRSLLDLLLTDARRHLQTAQAPNLPAPRRLEELRNSFQKFSEAKELDPSSPEAAAGEQRSRDQLAQELARQGRQLAEAPLRTRPNFREPTLPDFDTAPLEEGVGMLRDAQVLKPADPAIRKSLADAQRKLADAQNLKARSYMALEERVAWTREKLALLRMAREVVEKALDEVPDHRPAQQTREEINDRLARIHEEEADALAEQSAHSPLEQQAMQLNQAVDHYQQAQELNPGNKELPPKTQRTENKLADALSKLADKLMQGRPNESSEQQVARLEGADQALSQLQGLRPGPEVDAKAQQVGQQLDALRQSMGRKGSPEDGEPGEDGPPQPSPQAGQQMSQFGPPMDSRPKINTPGAKGAWQSQAMNSGRDY
ncbi:MAG: tetratricopeptide repeat protein [Verrucomicrobiota bacterium]